MTVAPEIIGSGTDDGFEWPGQRGHRHYAQTFGGGRWESAGANRPFGVVEVKLRAHGAQIHIRIKIGIEGADIAPVGIV